MILAILDAATAEAELDTLAAILHDSVQHGASVNFVQPFAMEQARAFWQRQLPALRDGGAVLFVARQDDGTIVGTVMLGLDMPPNQQHRADVKKLLVHSRARRKGLARALMQAAEAEAQRRGLTLLTLDTEHGSAAEPLYHALGYTLLGILPGYALAADGTVLQPCAFFYKQLA
ncbi:GNAT family N-acetyltransferase [Ferrovibrio sp.]|uniref:GNAT family N-acetyltransferase n=1 Tax=Ferrovibrio sp. TaxID=1917215 RepID=UPI000CAFC772|nr:GNAT family N-acetyltransferase [Ferrovibrio sp.]PJI44539.1 MAG: GNAT family N-acetyltransferase [Ferrovibrio sp.]